MRIGVDTSVLVRAHLPNLPRHEDARAYLLRRLADPDARIALTPLVLHELVHVITDARRFEPAVSMAEALAIASGYLGRSNVECLPADEASMRLALDLLARHRLGRNRVADSLLAGTFLSHGIRRVATFDVAGFAPFEGLEAFEPSA